MTSRPRPSGQLDVDSLQADVMRFMAIIAFCLIAMLALVKDLAPADPKPTAESVPASAPMRPAPVETVTTTRIEAPTPSEPAVPEERDTLTLRFASDRAFLHLIAGSEITLIIRAGSEFHAMANDFTLAPQRPSGELYEVMARSVPDKITTIAEARYESPQYLVELPDDTRGQLTAILSRVDPETAGGSLIIDRNGNIRHEND